MVVTEHQFFWIVSATGTLTDRGRTTIRFFSPVVRQFSVCSWWVGTPTRREGCFFLLLAILGACAKADQPREQRPVQVQVETVRAVVAEYFDDYPATVVPFEEVELRAEVGGFVTGIHFEDGQQVRKGQRLYTIDRRRYVARHDQARAQLATARADQQKAARDAERYQRLAREDAIARQIVENALSDLESAEARVRAAEAEAVQARTELSFSEVLAPLTGTIGISAVRIGAQVSPGQTALNTVSTDDPMAVDFEIGERDVPRFVELRRRGASADTLFRLQLPGGAAYPHPGHLQTLDRALNRQTGTLRVRLLFPNPDGVLRPGLNGNVRVRNRTDGPRVLIPQKALKEEMSEFFVFVVRGDSVGERKVQPGPRLSERLVIEKGLEAGEQVVVEGILKLRNGTRVQAQSAEVATSPDRL